MKFCDKELIIQQLIIILSHGQYKEKEFGKREDIRFFFLNHFGWQLYILDLINQVCVLSYFTHISKLEMEKSLGTQAELKALLDMLLSLFDVLIQFALFTLDQGLFLKIYSHFWRLENISFS